MTDYKKVPQPDASDINHALIVAAGKHIPIAGIAIEFMNSIIDRPIDLRRWEYVEGIAQDVEQLKAWKEEFKPENLEHNPIFLSSFMYAGQMAVRCHTEEKLKALRNAVLNTVIQNEIEDAEKQMFLNFIDIFTEEHILILKLLNNPRETIRKYGLNHEMAGTSVFNLITLMFPGLKEKEHMARQYISDLSDRGFLIRDESVFKINLSSGILESHTTEFGKSFLKFIESPLNGD